MKRRTFLTLLAAGLSAGCGRQTSAALRGVTMGTTYSIVIPEGVGSGFRETLHSDIENTLASVVRSMSTYDKLSELSLFNTSASTRWTPVSPKLFDVLSTASDLGALTNGAFDVTVGPLVNLWGFGRDWRPFATPHSAELAVARAQTGRHLLQLDRQSQWLQKQRPDVQVDLSSIAKGYGADRIAALLDTRGIDSYLIEIGGEFRVRGANADQNPWQLGVEAPDARQRKIAAVIEPLDGGIATSGNYRNFFDAGDRRYPHVIDPISGEPANHPPLSVTVLASSTMLADALTTALLVMGPVEGPRFANANGIAAVFVTPRDNIAASSFNVTGTATVPRLMVL